MPGAGIAHDRPTRRVVARTLRDAGVRLVGRRVLALCSGGADSVALVALLGQLPRGARPARLEVLFCDHGLRQDVRAEHDAAAAAAAHVGADLHVRCAPPLGELSGGVEGAARTWRYETAARVARQLDCEVVATGHGAHDQLEQALLSLTGVTGPAGRAATMAVSRPFDGDLLLVRPLLALDRAVLEASCASAGLGWAVDPTNDDPDAHVRNAVRHRVVPELLAACPAAGPALARSGDRARQDVEARAALADALLDAWGATEALSMRRLAELERPARRELVARWLLRLRPGRGTSARIVAEVEALATAPGRAACARVDLPDGACVRRDGYDLVVQSHASRGGPRP